MAVYRDNIEFSTGGHADTRDLTGAAEEILRNSDLDQGIMVLFCSSSTSGLTTIEYESGALSDLKRVFDEIAPQNREYRHNLRWGDGNGHSHVR
ncbi:MAG: YjbQ family protein, partial [Chloroflexota bacterium]